MALDLTSIAVGLIVGFVIGAVIFTPTGHAATRLAGEATRTYTRKRYPRD